MMRINGPYSVSHDLPRLVSTRQAVAVSVEVRSLDAVLEFLGERGFTVKSCAPERDEGDGWHWYLVIALKV